MRILDQQFVAHVFAAADGPGETYRALGEIWRGCGPLFGITGPVPGTGLELVPPAAPPASGEVAFAAAERPGVACQAVLRRHHDVLSLSVGLAPPEATAPANEGWRWWRDVEYQWNLLTTPHERHLLGQAQLYLSRVDDPAGISDASVGLYWSLGGLLPHAAAPPGGQSAGVPVSGGLAVWETSLAPEDRAVRRLVVAIAPDADAAASAWVWSDGGTGIPPLARYLLHAAKLRYELRVWRRDSQARRLQQSLDSLSAELRRASVSDPAREELLRQSRLDAKPAETIVLMFGEHRPFSDIGGLNYITVTDSPQCRRKIAGRLEEAGCLVDDSGEDWLRAGNFAGLAALGRTPGEGQP
jgi:hypothetical protein